MTAATPTTTNSAKGMRKSDRANQARSIARGECRVIEGFQVWRDDQGHLVSVPTVETLSRETLEQIVEGVRATIFFQEEAIGDVDMSVPHPIDRGNFKYETASDIVDVISELLCKAKVTPRYLGAHQARKLDLNPSEVFDE